jgi:hypothetical protein
MPRDGMGGGSPPGCTRWLSPRVRRRYLRGMTQNPPNLRPDLAPRARITESARPGQPTIGMVSLGCPKALVDSERILTRLRAEGYAISPDYAGADAVIVNTCGFLDSAKAESLEAIGDALSQNGRVIVTGCLGAEPEYITGAHPKVLAVTGPQQYEQVLDAVHARCRPRPTRSSTSATRGREADAAALQLSEDLRGLRSQVQVLHHPVDARRAELASRGGRPARGGALVAAGVKELLVISQDTSAYGTDWKGREQKFPILDLSTRLSGLGAWVRLHYVYPYPHVRDLIPMMADRSNGLLPYLDIPFQHAHPDTLRRMARPAAAERTLDEIRAGAGTVPTSPCGPPSSSDTPAKPRRSSRPCSTGWTRRSSIGWDASNTRTWTARGPTRCPITWPKRSRKSAGTASWKRRRRSRRRSSRPRSVSACRSSSMPSTMRRHLPHVGRRAGDRRQPFHRRGVRGLAPGDLVRSRWTKPRNTTCGAAAAVAAAMRDVPGAGA